MIGRGTRLCSNLLGEGMDKERFLIILISDNNFEYFRVNKNGAENGITESLNEKIYNTKARLSESFRHRYTVVMRYTQITEKALWMI